MPTGLTPTLRHWYQQGQFKTIRGQQLFFGVEGEGPTLLLIHGFPSASWDWHRLLPALRPHFQIIYLDMLGFGFSDKPLRAYPIGLQADLITDLLLHLNIGQAHILAHDYGDTVAQELLARQIKQRSPIRWLSCALLNGGLFPEAHRPLLIQKLLASPLGSWLAPLLGQRIFFRNLKRIWGQTSPSKHELTALWQLLQFNQGQRVIPQLIRYMNERRTHRARWASALTQSPIPLGLINGTADPISGHQLLERFRTLLPHCPTYSLDGVGHYPQLEAPQATVDALLTFHLERVASLTELKQGVTA
ncbi:alpha/beta hydrolase [Ferrimonas pelagia]|uniref:Alpha/beta hydrolase n=1 Tax=Ferrimonas pelagia TaxID=1177826 RepID=A0ABP9ETI6_9GAMM